MLFGHQKEEDQSNSREIKGPMQFMFSFPHSISVIIPSFLPFMDSSSIDPSSTHDNHLEASKVKE